MCSAQKPVPRRHELFPGIGCVQLTRAQPVSYATCKLEHLPEWFSEGTATGKSTEKTQT